MEYVKGRYYEKYIAKLIERIEQDERILNINKERIKEFVITLTLNNRKKSTILKYLSVMQHFLRKAEKDIDTLSDYEIKMLLFDLQQEMTRATFRNLKQAIKKYYRLKERNLWWITIEEENDIKGNVIPFEDIVSLFDAISKKRSDKLKIFYYLLWKTGARVGELLLLRKEDVRIHRDVVSLRLDLRAKNKPSRVVYLRDKKLADALKKILNNSKGRIFYYSYFSIAQDFRKLQKKVFGMVKYRLYDFRHTKATEMFQNEISYGKICSFMGWDISSDIPKRYYHSVIRLK